MIEVDDGIAVVEITALLKVSAPIAPVPERASLPERRPGGRAVVGH
jgi:hypothetical protein